MDCHRYCLTPALRDRTIQSSHGTTNFFKLSPLPSCAAQGCVATGSFFQLFLHFGNTTYTFNSQPFRNTGFTCLFASALLVKRRFLLSHSSLPGTRNAITPSSIHSAYG